MKIAVLQIRGGFNVNPNHKQSLNLLRLRKKNSCVVLDNTPSYTGVLVNLKDYITWGEIDQETFKILLEKRGRMAGNKKLTEEYLKEKVKMNYEQFTKNF